MIENEKFNRIEQYDWYIKLCNCLFEDEKIFEDFGYSPDDDPIEPEIDFSGFSPFGCMKLNLNVPVISPYISHELIADLLDLEVEQVDSIIEGKSVVFRMDSSDGRFKRGEVAKRSDIGKKNIGEMRWYHNGFAIAYLLWEKNYYIVNDDNEYDVPPTPRASKAIDKLAEYDLFPADVFLRSILVLPEVRTVIENWTDDLSKRNALTDRYYRIYKWAERCRSDIWIKPKIVLMANLPILQRRVDELLNHLVDLGLVFHTPYMIKTEDR